MPAAPDYPQLARFLIAPLLDDPTSLKLDCERNLARQRVWLRVAFEGTDKGRVFGRGGRTIQAIRAVLAATAQLVGDTLYLEIYGDR